MKMTMPSPFTAQITILTWVMACFSLAQNVQGPEVIPLLQGSQSELDGSTYVASVTLVLDNNVSIVIDTPSGPNAAGREEMLAALINAAELFPDQVDILVITHGHPDHFGHDMLFANARHIFSAFENSNTTYTPLNYQNGIVRLSNNVQLRQTPGHTQQDITVIVENVPDKGIVAITGDLIFDADDALNPSSTQVEIAWNVQTLLQNRNKILCEANYIVPGHGAMFEVTSQMRAMANCHASEPNQQGVLRIQKIQGAGLIRPSIFQRQGEIITRNQK